MIKTSYQASSKIRKESCIDRAEVKQSAKRLLFVVNEAYFFSSHRLNIARAAQKAGFEVHVAAPTDNVWAPSDYDSLSLRAENISVHPIFLQRRGRNPFADLRTFVTLYRLFKRLKPDVLHLVTIKPVLYGGLAARISRTNAIVCAVSGLGYIFTSKGTLATILRWLVCRFYAIATAHRNARVIVQNTGDANELERLGAVQQKNLVLIRGSGVDLDAFYPKPESNGPPLIVFASRLLWEKGVAEFIQAARYLSAENVRARFVIVGNTTTKIATAVPEKQLLAWVDEGLIEWWGRREDMPDVLAASHIVCLPSRYGEGVPKILIEAAASGRPIVATDIPGCREIVRNNGLLVKAGDSKALADALTTIVTDKELRKEMGKQGRSLACTEFSDTKVTEETLSIYEELLNTG